MKEKQVLSSLAKLGFQLRAAAPLMPARCLNFASLRMKFLLVALLASARLHVAA